MVDLLVPYNGEVLDWVGCERERVGQDVIATRKGGQFRMPAGRVARQNRSSD
jgi:hypothetical protein